MEAYNDVVFCDDTDKSYKVQKTIKAFKKVEIIGKIKFDIRIFNNLVLFYMSPQLEAERGKLDKLI